MKKFLGMLLVVAGTGILCAGMYFVCEYASYNYNVYSYDTLNRIFATFAIAGIVVILIGRKLYLATGESPRMKRVIGRLMLIIGVGLVVSGVGVIGVWLGDYPRPMWLLGVGLTLVGLIYLFIGRAKIRAGKIAISGSNQKTAQNAGTTNNASTQQKVPDPPPPQPKMMVCQECGKKYPLSQVYCDECGSLLKET